MENITKKARQILKDCKVLVDVMLESENTRIMIVQSSGTLYVLRFMNEKCHALVTLDDCIKMPVKTHYPSDSCKYVLEGIRNNTKNKLYASNDLTYLMDSSRWQSHFYEKLVITDIDTGNIVSKIIKDMPDVYYLPGDVVWELIKLLTELSKDLGIENSRRTLRLTYSDYTAILISGDNSKDISDSKYIYELGRVFSRLEYAFDFGIECVVFNPYRVCSGKIKCYGKESVKEPGSMRVVLE